MTKYTQPFDIYVISLFDSDRHLQVHKQFENSGVEYELLMFERMVNDQHSNYDEKTRLQRFGYPLLPGEIGCFDSHRACWRKVLEEGRPAIILEDDFIADNFEFIKTVSTLSGITHPLLVRLQGTFEKPFHNMICLNEFDLGNFSGDPAGTVGYFVNPAAAKKLFVASDKFFQAVDDFVCNEALHRCLVTGLQPYPIDTNDAPSTIGTRNKPNLTIFKKIHRELSKAIPLLRSHWYKLVKRPACVRKTLQSIEYAQKQ